MSELKYVMAIASLTKTNFESDYQKLNQEQRLAVDTIDGPVMVIAGAGTGKTQTIALRIGKILTETQTNGSSILCLTFTESAAINMRERLLKLIGSDSYSVKVCTFHAFCNSIITQYPEYFLTSKKESVNVSDIKQIQIIRTLIDNLPNDSALKNIASPYFYQNEILRSVTSLKKESIDPDKFSNLISLAKDFVTASTPLSEKLASIRAVPKAESEILNLIKDFSQNQKIDILYRSRLNLFLEYYHQGVYNLSALKSEVRDFITKTAANLPKLLDLHKIYSGYELALKESSLFDYDDMILKVISVLGKTPNLLADLQEKYQYILVDEFQDTNNSQYEIINLLTKNQENPNIFVVGDDDQSIYRFQGASVENIFTFYNRYQSSIKVIVLKNNYRSHKLILESSDNVITKNANRISSFIGGLDKSLVSVKDFDPDPINLYAANSDLEEFSFVSQKIKSLLDSGTDPRQIAVLYRNNADINDLLPFLSQRNINYLVSDSQNILASPTIQQLLTLFKFLINPCDDFLLSQILSFSFLRFNSLDLYKLLTLSRRQNLPLSQLILSPENLDITPKSQKRLKRFVKSLALSQKKLLSSPPDNFFNFAIRRFGFLKWVLRDQDIALLKHLNGLYSHLKLALQNEKISFADWIAGLDLLMENNLSLNSLPLQSSLENSIRLMTVHKAKGLEFEHVFLIKVLTGKWDSTSSRSLIKLPLGVVKTDINSLASDSDLEEDRRLFYVALTRAKNQIYISYSRRNLNNREQLVSLFVNDINPNLVEDVSAGPASESASLVDFFHPVLPELKSLDLESHLHHYLSTQYRFNITHFNSYNHCPLCFFFKTILRLPYPKTKSLSFGTSVHGALAYLFQVYGKTEKLISLEKFLDIFADNLKRENLSSSDYAQLLEHGQKILSSYYQHYHQDFSGNCLVEHDFKTYNVRLDNIPLTGKIDKIELLNHDEVNVVDYKTGKPDSKYKELSEEGDYYRQLVFYKLLCDQAYGFKYKVVSGTIDFIEPNSKTQYIRKNYILTPESVSKLSDEIKIVWQKIQNLEFPVGDKCDDKDHLHYLADKYFH